jgi:hypothetical protein
MTPQEKAQELVDKYANLAESIEWTDKETSKKSEKFNDELGTDILIYWNELAKQSALIAVDEIILEMDNVMLPNPFKQYWNEIKQEIEKL